MKIIWQPKFSVNIQEIDEQHRKLINMINDLDEAMSQGKGKDVLGNILNGLVRYTQTHFATEERLFTQHGYPESQAHITDHISFIKQVTDFMKDFRAGRVGLTIPTMSFLNNWLTQHIQGTDKKYSAFLNAKGVV